MMAGSSLVVSLAVAGLWIVASGQVRGLTIQYAWFWGVVAAVFVAISSAAACVPETVSAPYGVALQYLSAVLLLTPPMCTLGARRPGVGAWQFFVVLPMILVLLWPVASQLLSSRGREVAILGGPATAGILLVLIMSLATGPGTVMPGPLVCWFISAICSLLPSIGWVPPDSRIPLFTPWALLATGVTACVGIRKGQQAIREARSFPERCDAVWLQFQDLYGLLWMTRVMERVNQFVSREQWSVELTPAGFRRTDDQPRLDADIEQPARTLRWILQRFASDEWLADLQHSTSPGALISSDDSH